MSRAAGYIAELAAQAVVPALPRSTFRQMMPCRSCVVTLPTFVFSQVLRPMFQHSESDNVAWPGYHLNMHAKLLPEAYLCELVVAPNACSPRRQRRHVLVSILERHLRLRFGRLYMPFSPQLPS
jgi:hypothetical protein